MKGFTLGFLIQGNCKKALAAFKQRSDLLSYLKIRLPVDRVLPLG